MFGIRQIGQNEKQATSVLPRWKAGYQRPAKNNAKKISRYYYPTNSVSRDDVNKHLHGYKWITVSIHLTRQSPFWQDVNDEPPPMKNACELFDSSLRSAGPSPFEFWTLSGLSRGVLRWCSRSSLHAPSSMVNVWLTHPTLTDAGPPALPFKVRLTPQRGEGVINTKVFDQRERQHCKKNKIKSKTSKIWVSPWNDSQKHDLIWLHDQINMLTILWYCEHITGPAVFWVWRRMWAIIPLLVQWELGVI